MPDTETETTFATAPWVSTDSDTNADPGSPGWAEAFVWDGSGDLVCAVTTQLAGRGTVERAIDRADLIAAAGTAAHDLPDEYDAVEAQKAYVDIITATEDLIEDTYHREHPDGQPFRSPPSKEKVQALQDALQAARGE